MESLAVVLRRVPLFADLPPGSFAKIIADLREEIVEPGTVVCSEGDLATDFFVIRSGEVLVYVERATGERELVDTIGPNQGFGEAALFHECRRSATNVARTHVELWRLPKGLCQNNLTNSMNEIKLSVHENRRTDQRAVSFNPWFAG